MKQIRRLKLSTSNILIFIEDYTKPMRNSGHIEIISFILHLVIYVKIYCYKMRHHSSHQPRGEQTFKNGFLAELDKSSIETLSASIAIVAAITIHIKSTSYLSSLLPQDICNHKGFIYVHYLDLNFIIISMFLANRFIKNSSLRKHVRSKVVALQKDYFSIC